MDTTIRNTLRGLQPHLHNPDWGKMSVVWMESSISNQDKWQDRCLMTVHADPKGRPGILHCTKATLTAAGPVDKLIHWSGRQLGLLPPGKNQDSCHNAITDRSALKTQQEICPVKENKVWWDNFSHVTSANQKEALWSHNWPSTIKFNLSSQTNIRISYHVT